MAVESYLGFDPGGQTGVALLTIEGGQSHCTTYSARSVDDALNWATALLSDQTPNAAGVDSFLYWETGRSGWREADRWLRKQYPMVRNSVLSANSAYGAMSIQGMALAVLLRKRWPQIELIETHPKVLFYALAGRKHVWPSDMTEWLFKRMNCVPSLISSEHCWDAAASAWTALKGHTRSWKRDLRTLSKEVLSQRDAVLFGGLNRARRGQICQSASKFDPRSGSGGQNCTGVHPV